MTRYACSTCQTEQEVSEGDPAPECCGAPMSLSEAAPEAPAEEAPAEEAPEEPAEEAPAEKKPEEPPQ